ncbi:MAG: alpha/beta hydrolase [Alphaproteobacteria bacterium]
MIALFALSVFCLGFGALYAWNTVLARQAETTHPPIGRIAKVDGLDIHYVDRGTGPALVLMHGINGTVQDFSETVMDDLARRYRVIAIDRPGHGYSERADTAMDPAEQAAVVHGLLAQIGAEQPIMVGFSWSGSLVLAYALAYGDEVAGVVTLAGAAYEWPTPVDMKYRVPTWPIVGDLLVNTLPLPLSTLLAEQSVASAFAPEPVPDSYDQAPWRLALRPDSYRANAEDVRLLKPFLREQSARYHEIDVPLVIVTGDADTVVSPTLHSAALHEAVPHSQTIVLPGAGHPLPYSHPDVVIDAIDRVHRLAQAADTRAVTVSSLREYR